MEKQILYCDDSAEYLQAAKKLAEAEINILGFDQVEMGTVVRFEFPYRMPVIHKRVWHKGAAMVRNKTDKPMACILNFVYVTVQQLRELLEQEPRG